MKWQICITFFIQNEDWELNHFEQKKIVIWWLFDDNLSAREWEPEKKEPENPGSSWLVSEWMKEAKMLQSNLKPTLEKGRKFMSRLCSLILLWSFFMILEDSINSKFMRLLCPKKFSPGLCQVGSCSCQSFRTTQILESSPIKCTYTANIYSLKKHRKCSLITVNCTAAIA